MSIEAAIAHFQALEDVDSQIAKVAAKKLETAAKKQVADGTDPTGKTWPAKKDGTKPLVNAADAISTEASGNIVTVVVTGVEFYHQVAKEDGRSPPRRKLIPSIGDELPAHYAKAIKEATDEVLGRVA
jgi:hypothetical protein